MAIVRSARTNVKIKLFFLESDEFNLLHAVTDVMTLFNIQTADGGVSLNHHDLEQLCQGTVLIRNVVTESSEVCLSTEVFFRSENGSIQSIITQHSGTNENEDVQAGLKRLVKLNLLTALRKITGYNPGPWGILRGVRPSKIVHSLLDRGKTKPEIVTKLISDYAVELSKAELITDIALRQRSFLSAAGQAQRKVSVYIGIPYCPSRCLYCSFPANVLPADGQVTSFLSALQRDIQAAEALIRNYDLEVETVYIGGGTPTSLNSADFAWLLQCTKHSFVTAATREFTVEAGRPDSITDAKIATMCKYGVTRVSVNPQSMQQKTLKHIGRNHTIHDIINLFHKIRHAGIPVINMDVIVGLPGENEDDIADTMQQIAELWPDNVTIHTLALKRGSQLRTNLAEHIIPNEQITQNMLAIATEFAAKMQMKPYYLYRQKYMSGNLENIGYAKPGTECLYNIQIMEERQTIIGIGPAATTKAVDVNTWSLRNCFNAKDVTSYINRLGHYLEQRYRLLAELFA